MGSSNYYNVQTEAPVCGPEHSRFSLLPFIDFYWVDDTNYKDRSVTIGWLFWDIEIQLNRSSVD